MDLIDFILKKKCNNLLVDKKSEILLFHHNIYHNFDWSVKKKGRKKILKETLQEQKGQL